MAENINPYEVPKSDLGTGAVVGGDAAEAYFFTASTLKLTVMSLCTLGFYPIYWFYKNWVLIKVRTDRSIMPVWRAVFAMFWGFAAFGEVHKAAIEHKVESSLPVVWLGLFYLLGSLASSAPDPFWLISLFSFLAILPANTVAVRVNEALDDNFVANRSFSAWNWLAILLGGAMLLLVVAFTVIFPELLVE